MVPGLEQKRLQPSDPGDLSSVISDRPYNIAVIGKKKDFFFFSKNGLDID